MLDFLYQFLSFGYLILIWLSLLSMIIFGVLNIIKDFKQSLLIFWWFILLYGWFYLVIQLILYAELDLYTIIWWGIILTMPVLIFPDIFKELLLWLYSYFKSYFISPEKLVISVYDNKYLNKINSLIEDENYDKALQYSLKNKKYISSMYDTAEYTFLLSAIYFWLWQNNHWELSLGEYKQSIKDNSVSFDETQFECNVVDKLSHLWIDYIPVTWIENK